MINLPITEYKEQIVDAVRNNQVTIITAETGSGKSTQVPQYLAEHFKQVVVTEPRVMAAKTLATRVADEMGVTLGQEVGYNTSDYKCYSNGGSILYATDGLQLIKTLFNDNHETEKVLVIDEVHEWNLNIETLVAWCKFMLPLWNTKVVIMSATMDSFELANFFEGTVAVLNIPGKTFKVSFEQRSEESLLPTIKTLIYQRKNVLVFVAGKKEIKEVIEKLEDQDATVLPLHGEMDWEDQKRVFMEYENPKVIVSTNVAQTSLTIEDIDAVVDTGEARVSYAEDGIQGLFLKDISQAEILQRKGRAGRTKEGEYYLCSDKSFGSRDEYPVPEIQRSILDRVVLQIAAMGLDAEKLEFFHQPAKSAILNAKNELTTLGALANNKVTNLGYRIVKMPLSVQTARMVVEAEKYGVTESVLKIAAIIEMGGLLAKDGSYSHFSTESKSDLLAELDVWNTITNMGFIDFEELKINKKNFFRIKSYLIKLKQALYGIVTLSNNGDRDDILKACLSGLVSHVYAYGGEMYYCYDGSSAKLDRKSCLFSWYAPSFIVGIPQTIEFKDRNGYPTSMDLVRFASKIDDQTLFELVPSAIKEEEELRYSLYEDAIEVTKKKLFVGHVIDEYVSIEYHHPRYQELKAEFESARKSGTAPRQEYILIDGKKFEVDYCVWSDRKPTVHIDNETLYTTNVKEMYLDSGERVWFYSYTLSRKETNLVSLRNAAESKRIKRLIDFKKRSYSMKTVCTLDQVIDNADLLGEIQLTMSNGGYGDTPVYVYGCIRLDKKTVQMTILEDKELAEANTLEAIQKLFMDEVSKKYGPNKFSHQGGKKKKTLTDEEKRLKADFDSFVREVLRDVTIDTIQESRDMLEEYYQELMQ